jgi:hypothetical protein
MSALDPFALGGREDEPATLEQIAQVPFEPHEGIVWDHAHRAKLNDQIDWVAVELRIAMGFMTKTKAQLVESTRTLWAEKVDEKILGKELFENLEEAKELLLAFGELINAALTRYHIASAVVMLEEDEAP